MHFALSLLLEDEDDDEETTSLTEFDCEFDPSIEDPLTAESSLFFSDCCCFILLDFDLEKNPLVIFGLFAGGMGFVGAGVEVVVDVVEETVVDATEVTADEEVVT